MEWTNNFTVEKLRTRLKNLGTDEYNISYLSENLKVGEEPPRALMITMGNDFYYYKLINGEENV